MNRYLPLLFSLCLLLTNLQANAQAGARTPPVLSGGNDIWYYEIGGGTPLSVPNPRVTSTTLDASAKFNLGYSCGKFDPVAAVTNLLDQVRRDAERMYQALVWAARAAIANLPLYILQRANPGLYEMFQNALLQARAVVELATKTCEQMEAEMAQGKDPYREWAILSKGNDWKVIMGTEPDVVTAKDKVEDNNGKNGLPWIGGDRGGRNQPPIRVISDPVLAGYNLILNRAPTDTGAPPTGGPAPPRLLELWPTPEAARAWTVSVVGDALITTCEDCPKKSVPGVGLLPKVEEERAAVAQQMQKLVGGQTDLTLTQLAPVAAPGVGISPELIRVIRQQPPPDQPLIVGRLVDEIAMARTVERALFARRLLLSGARVPEVQAYELATRDVYSAVRELDKEIENLVFEKRVREGLVSETAASLLRRQAEQDTRYYADPRLPAPDPNRLRGGAVKPAQE